MQTSVKNISSNVIIINNNLKSMQTSVKNISKKH